MTRPVSHKFGLTPDDFIQIIRVLEKFPEVQEAIIFGSRAKGNYKPGSDVDIALKGRHLKRETITDIAIELNEETTMPYRFDVLNFNEMEEPELLEHIKRVGKILYTKDTNKNLQNASATEK